MEEERSAPRPTRTPSDEFEATSEPIFMAEKFTKTPPQRTLSRVGSGGGGGGRWWWWWWSVADFDMGGKKNRNWFSIAHLHVTSMMSLCGSPWEVRVWQVHLFLLFMFIFINQISP